MIVASIAVFLDYLDTSIVSIALPTISVDLGVGSFTASWVMTSYLLALGSTLLLFGKLADRSGRDREIFIAGFVLFTFASFLCGLSQDIATLIGFRVIQGIAAGMMVSTATMLITTRLPDDIRGIGMGIIATSGGIALALGPGLGGVVTEFISWHWIFFINIPVGIVGVVLAFFVIPLSEVRTCTKHPFDVLGAVLLTVTLVSLLLGLELGVSNGWTPPILLILGISPIAGFLFFRWELRHSDPVLSASLFLNRNIMWASLSTLLVTLVYLGVVYLMPFYLTTSYQFSVMLAGLVMLLPPISMALIGIPAGAIINKFGCKRLCNKATIILSVGLLALVFGVVLVSLPLLFAGLFALGLGMGLNEGPSMRRITIQSPREDQGSSGGLVFTVMNIGCILGVAIFSAAASIGSGGSEVFTDRGIVVACMVGFIVAVCAYVASSMAHDKNLC